MSTIRPTNLPVPPVRPAEAQATDKTQAKGKTPSLTADGPQLSAAYKALNASGLTPPKPPLSAVDQPVTDGATSFGGQLMDMGGSRASSEAMMLAFLKLQILDSNHTNQLQRLCGLGRSALFSDALRVQKGTAGRAAQAKEARTSANTLDSSADQEVQKGHDKVKQAGVDPKEVERLVEQSVKEGKKGDDVIDRYATAHQGDPNLKPKLNALRRAEPHYRAAAKKYEEAEELREFAANISGGWVLGAATTLMTRAGTQGMAALLATQEAQRQLLNQLMALLAGIRPDAKAKDEAMVEMDNFRNEVAKLTLDYIDGQRSAAGRLQLFNP